MSLRRRPSQARSGGGARTTAKIAGGGKQSSAEIVDALDALKLTIELGTALDLLQRFLRAEAVELIAVLCAGGATAATVLPLFEKRAPALEEAREQARLALGVRKPAPDSFWEASI